MKTMPIKPLSLALPETRFLHTTKHVYKFKIRYGVHFKSEDAENNEHTLKELLDSIRAVLANHDNLHPFSTKHFIIFPYKSNWDSASRLRFKHGHKFLLPFPYVFTIYIEPNSLVYEGCSEKNSEEHNQHVDEDMRVSVNCRNVDTFTMSLTSSTIFLLLAVLILETQSFDSTTPGCQLHPFNVTIRSDRRGTCRGTQVINACVGHCESSAFPSKYSVLVASGYKHNITSVSQCCTISKLQKVKVRLFCGASRWEEIEIGSAEACQCDMCRLSRY